MVILWYQSFFLCEGIVTLVAYEIGIGSHEANGRLSNIGRLYRKILPERVRQQIFWNWFDEYLVVVPDQVQLRILGDSDVPSSDSLMMQRRDL